MQLHTLYKVPVGAPTNQLVEVGKARKSKLGTGVFAATTDDRSDYVARLGSLACSLYGGWNGFTYPGYGELSQDLRPMVPAFGVVKPLETLGDSGLWFANFQWKKWAQTGSGSNLPRTFDVQAQFFKDLLSKVEGVALGAFVLDCFRSLQSFYASGVGVPLGADDPYHFGKTAVSGLKATGIPVWFVGVQVVAGPHAAKSGELMLFLANELPNAKFVQVHIGNNTITPSPIPANRIIHGFPVAIDGTYEGTFGVVPAMTPAEFKADVLNNPAFASSDVLCMSQTDSVQVANQL